MSIQAQQPLAASMLISVILPAWNGASYIREALESVYSQTLLPGEIIVVDDASTDGTRDIVQEISRQGPVPLRLISEVRNHGGPAGPLNVGIAAAAGRLIAVLDQDDVFLPDKLEQQSRVLVSQPEIAAVAGICASFPGVDHEYVPVPLREEISLRGFAVPSLAAGSAVAEAVQNRLKEDVPKVQFLTGPDALHILMGHGNFVTGFPGFMFRKSDWSARGGLDEGLKIAADLEFFCWLCTRGDVAFMPIEQYRRREHDANMCRDRFAVNWELHRVCLRYRSQAARGRCECRLDRSLRDLVFSVAWWAKDQGRFATSAQVLLQGLLNWPYDWRMSAGLMKLPLHWFRARLTA